MHATAPVIAPVLTHPSLQPVELSRGGADLSSRVADNLFWLGRYMERADAGTRVLRLALGRALDESGETRTPELPAVVQAVREFWQLPARVSEDASRQGMAALEHDLMNVAFGDNRTGNLRGIVDAARRTAWLVRERLANDLWRILNRVEALLLPPQGEDEIRSIHAIERLNEIVFLLSAFSGLSNENMTRGIGWRFLDMGRRIERAMNAVALLRCCLLERVEREGPCLEAVLDLGDSLITYRSRYRATLQIAPVLDLLLVDETNPRSVAYQLHALGAHLNYLQGNRSTPVLSDEQRTVLEATTTLRLIDVHQLGEANERHVRERLDTLLEHLAVDVSSLSDIITRAYFSHTQPTRQLNPLHTAYGA